MLTKQLHFFPVVDEQSIRVAYQFMLSVYVCFNCKMVWYQEEFESELKCGSCSKMAKGYLVSSHIYGTDLSWEEYCDMLNMIGAMVDNSITGMISEGAYFSYKDIQIIFAIIKHDDNIVPIWRIFIGADGFTRSIPEMKVWINEGFQLRDYIVKNGWPSPGQHTIQQNDTEDLDISSVLKEAESILKQEK